MKKLTLLIAALVLTFTAQATVVNCNPGTNNLSWYLTQGDTLVLADGEYIEQWSFELKKEGVVVMAAEGAKPIIKASSYLQHKATTTFIGITFDGQNTAEYATYSYENTAKDLKFVNCEFMNYTQYTISASSSAHVDSLIFENCVLDGSQSTLYAIYAKGTTNKIRVTGTEIKDYKEHGIKLSDAACVDALIVTNSLIHDCAYTAIQIPAAADGKEKQSCSSFELTNSTIYNIGDNTKDYGAIDIRDNANIASTQQVLIDHVTLYNFTTKDWYGGFMIYKSANATISNCIASNPDNIYTKYCNPFHAYVGATINNCIYYNAHISSESTATYANCEEADPMFVDAANGDFMLYAESPAIGMGDPRWGVKAGLQPGYGKLKAAVNAAQAGATIELGDGIYEEPSSIDFNKEGLTIKAAEGTNPVVKASSYLKHNATTTFIGITFDGQDVAEYTTYSYTTDTEKDLTFINCEFKGYTKSCVTLGSAANVNKLLVDGCTFDGGSKTPAAIKSSGIISACDIKDSEIKGYTEYGFVANSSSAHTDELSVDNTIIHDCGYSAIYVTAAADGKEKQSCSSFELTNSTIYNIGNNTQDHGVVDIRDNANITSAQQVRIDHVTLYNFNTKDWYGGFMIYQSANATISNCIVSNPADLSGKNGYHVYGNAVVTNSLYHNCNITSGAQQTANIKADPLFVDAANANFMLSANSPAVGKGTDGSNLGDTRWGVSAKVLGKRINVTPDQASSLPWMIQSDESNVKAGDTIVLADGQYTLSTIKFIKENLVVIAAENAKPEIISASEWANLEISANTTFDGITFNGNTVAQYLISIQDSTTMKTKLVLQNCELKNWKLWAISNQYSDNVVVDSLIIDNCLFHDGTGSAIHFNENAPAGKNACEYFKMTNTTLYNIVSTSYAGIVQISSNGEAEGDVNTVIIDHITLYNFDAADLGAISIRKTNNMTITNSIIATPEDKGQRALYVYGGTVDNTIHYNGSKRSGNTVYTKCENTDPLFVDAANNNFKLKGNSPAIAKATDGSNLGDPRWGVEAIVIGEGDNTAALATQGTALVQVNREFIAGKLYTIALPFTLTDVVSIFGQGTIVYEYDKLLEQNGEVVLHFKEVNTISAGKPYLLKPAQNVDGFVVNNVTLSNSTQTLSFTVGTTTIAMEPVLSVTSGQTTEGKHWLASDTYLYDNTNALPSLRALFTISTPSGIAPRARVALGENVETGLDNNQLPNTNIQKVLENGQLIIIRDGVKYNVQGQVIK